MNPRPLVTFVVPCFKLAHVLGECLSSICGQSYPNLEILVMDDCSPDDVAWVIGAFGDARVQHIRNEPNLGHLRNYNKGIALAKGEYIWLISADDVLRDRSVVERLVAVLERNPRAGYAFCPAVRFTAAGDRGPYGSHGDQDRIFRGEEFLREWLVLGNSVPAAAGLVRRVCYERLGGFPLDMPFAGDWYMWALFALYYDVAYLAAPMVGYRTHDGNMTLEFKGRPAALVADMLRVRWSVYHLAQREGMGEVARAFKQSIAHEYAFRTTQTHVVTGSYRMVLDELNASLEEHCQDRRDRAYMLSAVYAALGDLEYEQGTPARASEHYDAALRENPFAVRTRVKHALSRLGSPGHRLRAVVSPHKPLARATTGDRRAIPTR
jgi:glycosyltransferase involved in cell wall biosynthesis